MSRDCLLQVTLASTKRMYHINFGNGFDLLNIFNDHNSHMLLFKLYAAAANQNHTHDSEGAPQQTYLVMRELTQKKYLKDAFQQLYLTLKELVWTMTQISTKASRVRLLGLTTLPSSILTQAFASEVIPFDTDSSFWVCDNSATGHICNNKSLFPGELVPLIYIVGAAMGTTEPSLMGTVILCTTDNNGKKHSFTLTHVNYMPKLPVNLLST
jgi:hypothetical protein